MNIYLMLDGYDLCIWTIRLFFPPGGERSKYGVWVGCPITFLLENNFLSVVKSYYGEGLNTDLGMFGIGGLSG